MRTTLLASFGLLVAVTAGSNTTQTTTCAELLSALPSRVFFPEAAIYDASISSYPFLQLRLHPNCIVRPKSAYEVSMALGVLKENNRTRFAIKGGGHNANAGFNNVANGVTIDMQGMKDVEVARGDNVVRVGAGALSQDAYDVAEKRNLTVLAGRIGVVGTAGFLTGGGVSFLSPQFGWACDTVINFEVVLASGEIVNANATSRSDLFVALKGGQNNFGVVTRFDLKAFPASKIRGGRIVYAPSATKDLLTAFTNFKSATKVDPYVAGWVTVRYNHTAALFNPVAIMWYTKPELKPGGLKEITEVRPQVLNGMVEAPVSEHTRNASRAVLATPRRTVWATTSFYISPTIVQKVHAIWKGLVPEISETYASANPSAELTFQALPPPPQNGSTLNSLGLSTNETPGRELIFLQIVFTFDGADATEGLEKGLKDLIEVVEELTQEEGVYHPFKYLNFAAWFQNPLEGYGRKQKRKLREVARKYDPAGMFQKQVSGGFKLL